MLCGRWEQSIRMPLFTKLEFNRPRECSRILRNKTNWKTLSSLQCVHSLSWRSVDTILLKTHSFRYMRRYLTGFFSSFLIPSFQPLIFHFFHVLSFHFTFLSYFSFLHPSFPSFSYPSSFSFFLSFYLSFHPLLSFLFPLISLSFFLYFILSCCYVEWYELNGFLRVSFAFRR